MIDTPGMRELGMWDSASGVEETFSEIERWLTGAASLTVRIKASQAARFAGPCRRARSPRALAILP